jgi:hypothetical protein
MELLIAVLIIFSITFIVTLSQNLIISYPDTTTEPPTKRRTCPACNGKEIKGFDVCACCKGEKYIRIEEKNG